MGEHIGCHCSLFKSVCIALHGVSFVSLSLSMADTHTHSLSPWRPTVAALRFSSPLPQKYHRWTQIQIINCLPMYSYLATLTHNAKVYRPEISLWLSLPLSLRSIVQCARKMRINLNLCFPPMDGSFSPFLVWFGFLSCCLSIVSIRQIIYIYP